MIVILKLLISKEIFMANFFDVDKNFSIGSITTNGNNTDKLKLLLDEESITQAIYILLQTYSDDILMDTTESPLANLPYSENDEETALEIRDQLLTYLTNKLPLNITELVITPYANTRTFEIKFKWEWIENTNLYGEFTKLIQLN